MGREKKLRGGIDKNKVSPKKSGGLKTDGTTSSTAASVVVVLKSNKPIETVKDNPTEIITSKGRVHDFGGKKVFQATMNDSHYILLYTDTNEKVFLKENSDEYITNNCGRETQLGSSTLQFIKTNKSELHEEEKDQWIMIDLNTLEKVKISLNDDPTEYITNRSDQGQLGGHAVQGVWTNKAGDKPILIDVDTLKKLDLHVKDHPEDKITSLGQHVIKSIVGGRDVVYLVIGEKTYLIYTDTLERVSIKDNPEESLTNQIHDYGTIREFITPFGGRDTGKFVINNDKNNTVILYLDTLEKVRLRHGNEVITDYTCQAEDMDYNRKRKISFEGRPAVIAHLNNNDKTTAVYADTLETVKLKAMPNEIIQKIRVSGTLSKGGEDLKILINEWDNIWIDPNTGEIKQEKGIKK